MSDLVERVGKAIRSKADFDSDEIARAAIKAVAEWLAQTEDRECNPLQALADQLKESSE
jgi:hypothetical protein